MEWPKSLQVARGGTVTLLPALLVTMSLVLHRPKTNHIKFQAEFYKITFMAKYRNSHHTKTKTS